MSRELVIFSERFPFGTSETFLANELPYLLEVFERVAVVPRIADGTPRRLPPGVRLDLRLAQTRARGLLSLGEVYRASRPILGELLALAAVDERRSVSGLRRLARFVRTALRVRAWWTEARPDPDATLFYSYWFEAIPVGLALLKQRAPELRFVARAHRWDLYEEDYEPAWFPWRELALSEAERVFPISQHGIDHLAARFPAHRGKLELARLGVESAGTSRASSDGVIRIASCSALIERKRVERIAYAVRVLAERHPERRFEWVHAGDGPTRASIEAIVRGFPAHARTMFMGSVPNAEVRTRYTTDPVDVFVNASSSEGVPVSIMEALSAEIPVVATDVGATREVLPETAGILLSADPTPEELADAIARLSLDSARRGSLRIGARAVWAELADADRNFRSFAHRLASI